MSCDLCRPDHLPLSILIAPSYFGSLVLTVASPCDCLVSLLSIFPLSLYTQCPVLSVDPLSVTQLDSFPPVSYSIEAPCSLQSTAHSLCFASPFVCSLSLLVISIALLIVSIVLLVISLV